MPNTASPSACKQKVKAEFGKPGRNLANLPALPLNYKIGQEFRTPERPERAKEEKSSNRSILFSLVTVSPAEGEGEDSPRQLHQNQASPVNLDRVMALLEPPRNFISSRPKTRGVRRKSPNHALQTEKPESPQSSGEWTLPLISSTDQDGDRRGRMATRSMDSGILRVDGNADTTRSCSREHSNSKRIDSKKVDLNKVHEGGSKPLPNKEAAMDSLVAQDSAQSIDSETEVIVKHRSGAWKIFGGSRGNTPGTPAQQRERRAIDIVDKYLSQWLEVPRPLPLPLVALAPRPHGSFDSPQNRIAL